MVEMNDLNDLKVKYREIKKIEWAYYQKQSKYGDIICCQVILELFRKEYIILIQPFDENDIYTEIEDYINRIISYKKIRRGINDNR